MIETNWIALIQLVMILVILGGVFYGLKPWIDRLLPEAKP